MLATWSDLNSSSDSKNDSDSLSRGMEVFTKDLKNTIEVSIKNLINKSKEVLKDVLLKFLKNEEHSILEINS